MRVGDVEGVRGDRSIQIGRIAVHELDVGEACCFRSFFGDADGVYMMWEGVLVTRSCR